MGGGSGVTHILEGLHTVHSSVASNRLANHVNGRGESELLPVVGGHVMAAKVIYFRLWADVDKEKVANVHGCTLH